MRRTDRGPASAGPFPPDDRPHRMPYVRDPTRCELCGASGFDVPLIDVTLSPSKDGRRAREVRCCVSHELGPGEPIPTPRSRTRPGTTRRHPQDEGLLGGAP